MCDTTLMWIFLYTTTVLFATSMMFLSYIVDSKHNFTFGDLFATIVFSLLPVLNIAFGFASLLWILGALSTKQLIK